MNYETVLVGACLFGALQLNVKHRKKWATLSLPLSFFSSRFYVLRRQDFVLVQH